MTKESSLLSKIRLYSKLTLQRHRQGHLPFWRQFFEMAGMAIVTGNGPGFYLMAGLFRRTIPWREKYQHLGSREYLKKIRKLNPHNYRSTSQNKLTEKGIIQLLGYPTPRFVGHLHPSFGQTHDGSPLQTAADFTALFRRERLDKVCFKLLEGHGGEGFEAMEILKEKGHIYCQCLKKGKIVPIEEYYNDIIKVDPIKGVLIENYFVQHPTLAAFNPESVNTCRLWVLAKNNFSARSVLGYLRIGRKGSLVDNQSRGGIVAPIELETGRTKRAIDGLPQRREYPFHPDHGAPIEGQDLPFWNESKALAESCLASFPGLGFAGLDIGISPSGPAVLEMNVQPDREGAAFVDLPSGQVLPP